jgi:hypothetical protein
LPHAFLQLIVCRSAVDCLKSQRAALLSQDMWWEGAFACTHTSIVACTSPNWLLYSWLGTSCEFHTEQWVEPCSVPISCLPHAFLQSIVCRSAVDCLKSWRAARLLQDTQWEGAFACTHTSILACTSPNWLLYSWLGTCVNLYWTVRGALLCSCQLFAPHFSAIDSLQECSWLFEEPKGGAAFAG